MPTLIEEKLTRIWQELLVCKEIGLDDDFVDLGGDSLSAMLCISRIRTEFHVNVPIDEFFMDQATISAMAALIAAETAGTPAE